LASLKVLRPGMLTTVQDLGRWGHQHAGVAVAGPMDAYSHRRANRLVGNPDGASALEVTLLGPEVEFDSEVVCASAGARFALTVDGAALDADRAFVVPAGVRLRFGARLAGARATLAVRGGVDVPPTLGSRATSLASRMGPFGGRALAAGDVLRIGAAAAVGARPAGGPMRIPDGGARLRVLLGPHDALFTPEALDVLLHSRFIVSPQSNRMGYRLEGPPLAHLGPADILSDATPVGSLQVPASGQPILLMADRQTTGGYSKIATVISADLPLAGQLAPGDWIRFSACTRAAAIDALAAQESVLSGDAPLDSIDE
jgi:antagonist of KipI